MVIILVGNYNNNTRQEMAFAQGRKLPVSKQHFNIGTENLVVLFACWKRNKRQIFSLYGVH